jgi:vacuolar-type H+-ATPase subunit I/STV1
MAFNVEEFQDLIRLLQQRPEWRADLRRLVLSDELLALPESVRELVQAQQRTEGRVGRLEEAQQRTEARVGQLAESVESLRAETERRFQELATAQLTLTRRIDDLREAVQTLADRTYTLTTDVGELKGSDLERRYRERPFAYFQRLVRQAHTLSGDELNAMLDRAVTAGQLTEEDVDEIVWADAIVRGRRREDDQEVYLVVEASWGVGPYDVQRADKRAKLLAKAGVTALPVVAGMWVTPDGELAARAIKVWRVTNGRTVPPEPS